MSVDGGRCKANDAADNERTDQGGYWKLIDEVIEIPLTKKIIDPN